MCLTYYLQSGSVCEKSISMCRDLSVNINEKGNPLTIASICFLCTAWLYWTTLCWIWHRQHGSTRKAEQQKLKITTYLNPPFIWNKGTSFNVSQCFWGHLHKISGLGEELRLEQNIDNHSCFEYLHTVFILVSDQVAEDF